MAASKSADVASLQISEFDIFNYVIVMQQNKLMLEFLKPTGVEIAKLTLISA
jgi:hypothetical protein